MEEFTNYPKDHIDTALANSITPSKGNLLYSLGIKLFVYSFTIISAVISLCSVVFSQYYEYMEYSNRSFIAMTISIVALVWMLLMLTLSTIVSGRNRVNQQIHLHSIDKIPIEILLLISITTIILCLNFTIIHDVFSFYQNVNLNILLLRSLLVSIIFAFFGGIIVLSCVLSIARQLKAKNNNCICLKFSSQIFEFAKWSYKKTQKSVKEVSDISRFSDIPFQRKIFLRQLIYIGILLVMLIINLSVVGHFFPMGLWLLDAVVFIFSTTWFVKHNNKVNEDIGQIIRQIDQIHKGNLNFTPIIKANAPLFETSYKLSDISAGFQRNVDERIKSERMKIELVTNVSHDLKTPLTSIISYVNLLSKDETLSPEARDYVNILSQKSDRLKQIVADLFDLAKVTSGSTELQQEQLDMSKLVIQTLADMEDRIEESGQIIKQNIAQPPIPIYADGRKMYRVLQNIFDNALKYAMKGTRIFIDLTQSNRIAELCVKNTAGYEIDFNEEEILERFSRGDKARSTEGSGLGLSIAQGFTQACGGKFDLIIDGDQFKVIIAFPIQQASPETETQKQQTSIVETTPPPQENPVDMQVLIPVPPTSQTTNWNYIRK